MCRNIFFIFLTVFMESDKVYGNKYCAFELDGEAKYYMCPRNEYCCNFGCCVNLAFQFYQLWYYWLLIIVMFMICSGGGWWYRFCRQSDSSSSYPSITQNVNNSQNFSNRHNSRDMHQRNAVELTTRRARATSAHRTRHNNHDHSQYYIQQIWKGPSNQNVQLPPSYYSSTQQPFNQECPYHILYGPPPSYDSIIQITDTTGAAQPTCTLVEQPPVLDQQQQTSEDENQPSTSGSAIPLTELTSQESLPFVTTNKKIDRNVDNEAECDGARAVSSLTISCSNYIDDGNSTITETTFNTIPSTSKIKSNEKNDKISSV